MGPPGPPPNAPSPRASSRPTLRGEVWVKVGTYTTPRDACQRRVGLWRVLRAPRRAAMHEPATGPVHQSTSRRPTVGAPAAHAVASSYTHDIRMDGFIIRGCRGGGATAIAGAAAVCSFEVSSRPWFSATVRLRTTRCLAVGKPGAAGGAYATDGAPAFEDCLFRGNQATDGGAGAVHAEQRLAV